MTASQVVAAVAWVSVLAAPWAAWATDTSFRSPWFVATVATAVLIGAAAGMHHQGQVAITRRDTLAAVERQMAQAEANRAASERRVRSQLTTLRSFLAEMDRRARELREDDRDREAGNRQGRDGE